MNEEEREIVKKFERLYLKDFNNEKITNEDRLSYIECALMSNLIEKLQKENEELKEEKEQAWEEWNNLEQGSYETEQKLKQQIKKLQKENEELKNQEATARRINELLVQRYSNSIPVQKVKDKIRKNEEIIDISNDGDLIHELFQKNKVYEELLESEE